MILIIPAGQGSSCCFRNCCVIWPLSNLFTAGKRGILKTSSCEKSITYEHILQRLKYGLEYLWAGGVIYDTMCWIVRNWAKKRRRRSKIFDVSDNDNSLVNTQINMFCCAISIALGKESSFGNNEFNFLFVLSCRNQLHVIEILNYRQERGRSKLKWSIWKTIAHKSLPFSS